VVESDGEWLLVVKVPTSYGNQLEGLCGNYDGKSSNDFITKDGVDVQFEDDAHIKFGNSWQVPDDTEPT